MPDELRPCPTAGCGARIGRHLLMCRDCWRQVPARLRREVNLAYRRWKRLVRAQSWGETRQAADELRVAQGAAIAAVNAGRAEVAS